MAQSLFSNYFQQSTGGGTSAMHGGVGHHPIAYPQQSGFAFNQPLTPFNGGLGSAAPSLPEWSRLYAANHSFDPTGGAFGQQSQNTLTGVMQSQNPTLNTNTTTPGQVQAPNVLNPQNVQDWFQKSVVNPSMLNYQQNIAPAIDSNFAGQGGIFNSRRGYTQAQALNQLQTQNAASLGNMSMALNQQQAGMENQNALQHNADLMNTQQFNAGMGAQQAQLGLQNQAQQMQAAALGQNQLNQEQQRLMGKANLTGAIQDQNNRTMGGQYNEFLRTQPYNNPYEQQAMQFLGANMQTQIPYTPQSMGSMIGQGLGMGMMGQSMGLLPSASGLGALASGDASLSLLGLPLGK